MSTDAPIGYTVGEKIVGLVLLILGAFFANASLTPPAGDVSHFGTIFVILGIVVALAGIFLILPKRK